MFKESLISKLLLCLLMVLGTICSQAKTFLVINKFQFLESLNTVQKGDTIYITNNSLIDLTGLSCTIPVGVIIYSERNVNKRSGGIIISKSFYPERNYTPMLRLKDSTAVIGCRLQGPNGDMADHGAVTQRGVANAIMIDGYGVKILNNEIFNFDKWAIYMYKSTNCEVAYNYIHNCQLQGYGYGVWVGGSSVDKGGWCTIHHNIFNHHRHAIASSGHYTSWHAYNNVFLRNQTYINLDRHGQSRGATGGLNTWIKNNKFYTRQQHFGFALPAIDTSLKDSGSIVIEGNYFAREEFNFGYIADTLASQIKDNRVIVKNNYFNGLGTLDDTVNLVTNNLIGYTPLNIIANAFTDGRRYYWGIGLTQGEVFTSIGTFSRTFNTADVFTLSCWVEKSNNDATRTIKRQVVVKPTTNNKVLVASIKDSYWGSLTGRYEKQIWINNQLIWRDDVAGNEGWSKITLDITNYLSTNLLIKDTLKLRLASINGEPSPRTGVSELNVWFDDIYIFNSGINMEITNFEDHPSVLAPWKQKPNGIGSGITSEESRSGDYSFSFDIGLYSIWGPNKFAEITYVLK